MTFYMDGREYTLRVTALERKFSVQERNQGGYTMDGVFHRDILGTYYHYTMTLEAYPGGEEELEALWQAVSQPVESHLCRFPYGQQTLQQRMYIQSGSQELPKIQGKRQLWGGLKLEFTALAPEVLP